VAAGVRVGFCAEVTTGRELDVTPSGVKVHRAESPASGVPLTGPVI
jgi:hypothetical protein